MLQGSVYKQQEYIKEERRTNASRESLFRA